MIIRRKDKNENIGEIKKAIDKPAAHEHVSEDVLDVIPELRYDHEKTPEPPEPEPEPELDLDDEPEEDTMSEMEPHPVSEPVSIRPSPPPTTKEAPLFVKLDKYKDIISLIQEMKVFVVGIKQLFNILQELENVRMDAVKIMKATIQRLERRMIEIDNEMIRPRGFQAPEMPHTEVEVHHVEDSLTDLQKELAKLRGELNELK